MQILIMIIKRLPLLMSFSSDLSGDSDDPFLSDKLTNMCNQQRQL